MRAGLLALLLMLPWAATAEQTPEKSAAYVVDTGDAWVDAQLQDINHYAERYPDSFLDEVARYAGVSRGYIAALMYTHGWQAASSWFEGPPPDWLRTCIELRGREKRKPGEG